MSKFNYRHLLGMPALPPMAFNGSRPAATYRAARRNSHRVTTWPSRKPDRVTTQVSHRGTIRFWNMSAAKRSAFMRGGNFDPSTATGPKPSFWRRWLRG